MKGPISEEEAREESQKPPTAGLVQDCVQSSKHVPVIRILLTVDCELS